jgi:DNA-binding NarL/FixJ family response regulator
MQGRMIAACKVGIEGDEMKLLWTKEEEERLRKLLQGNAKPDEIAKELHRSVSSVKSKAHAMGLTVAQLGNFRRRLSKWS